MARSANMKLYCVADNKSWVELVDVWTRKKYTQLFELAALPEDTDEQRSEKDKAIKSYMQSVINDVCLYDINGTAHRGLDTLLQDDVMDNFEFDIAVEAFWANVIHEAYRERSKMGNAVRRN